MFTLLTAHLLSDACAEAQQNGEHRLALLIAQAAHAHFPRQLLQRQLADWLQCQVCTQRTRLSFCFCLW